MYIYIYIFVGKVTLLDGHYNRISEATQFRPTCMFEVCVRAMQQYLLYFVCVSCSPLIVVALLHSLHVSKQFVCGRISYQKII